MLSNVHENLSKGPHMILLYMGVSHKNFKSKIVHLVFIHILLFWIYRFILKFTRMRNGHIKLSNNQIKFLI